jgi:multicomponent Na+:H+ antiporter subunit E
MRGRLLRVWTLTWLVLVWLLLWGTVSTANVLSGLAVALAITVLLPLPAVPVQGRLHPLSAAWLILNVGWWLVKSSTGVAWLTLRPARLPTPAVLRAELTLKSDLVLALAVNILNLTPGTLVLEIDQVRRLIYVHVLDGGSPSGVQRFHRQVARLERRLIAAFERESEWRPSATDFDEEART